MLTIEIEELEQRIAPDGGERCYHSKESRLRVA